MDFLQSTELVVPLYQIALLLVVSTVALLFGKVKLALITNYLFTMYWGYGFNREQLIGHRINDFTLFTLIYFGFGLFIVIFAVLGFFGTSER